MKLTEWFPPEIKPVHYGVYEVRAQFTSPWFRKWNGRVWCYGEDTVNKAAQEVHGSNFGVFGWRGLAQKP